MIIKNKSRMKKIIAGVLTFVMLCTTSLITDVYAGISALSGMLFENEVIWTTESTVSVTGKVSYNDEGWKEILRPASFDKELKCYIYSDDSTYKQYSLQELDSTSGCYFKPVYDSEGGLESFQLRNVPNKVKYDGSIHNVSKIELIIEADDFYKECKVEISNPTVDLSNINLIREPELRQLTVSKSVIGMPEAATEEFVYALTVGMSKDAGKLVTKPLTINYGTDNTAVINVPINTYCTLIENALEGYGILSYKMGDISSATSAEFVMSDNMAVEVTGVYNNVTEQFTVTWNDNYSQSRPTPEIQLNFTYEGITEPAAVKDYLVELGIDTVPTPTVEKDLNVDTYTYNGLPAVINIGGIYHAVTYITEEKALTDYKIVKDANDNYTNIKTEDFVYTVVWKDSGAYDADGNNDTRPDVESYVSLLKLYRYTAQKPEKVPMEYGVDFTVEGQDSNTWVISVPNLEMYDKDGNPYVYYIVEGTANDNNSVTQEDIPLNPEYPQNNRYSSAIAYSTQYDNGTGTYGNVIDRGYDSGRVIHVITDNTEYTAKLIWKDNISEDAANRPFTTLTLWRYSLKAQTDTVNFDSSAKVVAKKDGSDYILEYRADTGSVENETIDFIRKCGFSVYQLPKFDENGYEYAYFTRAVNRDNGTTTNNYEITYHNNAGGSLSYGAVNGGDITNTRVEEAVIEIASEWITPSALDNIAGLSMEVVLAAKNSAGEFVTIYPETAGENVLSGFSAEETSKSISYKFNTYDEYGKKYELIGIKVVSIKKGDLAIALQYSDYDIICEYTLGTNADKYKSSSKISEAASVVNGMTVYKASLKNVIQKEVEYTIKKVWGAGTDNGKSTAKITFNLKGYSQNKSNTEALYNENHKMTASGIVDNYIWNDANTTLTVNNLPKYDDDGYLIEYKATEIITGYSISYAYTEYGVTVTNNTTGGYGYYPEIHKEWYDGGDISTRQNVEIHAFSSDGTIDYAANTAEAAKMENGAGLSGKSFQYSVTLSANNQWTGYMHTPLTADNYIYKEVKAGDTNITYGEAVSTKAEYTLGKYKYETETNRVNNEVTTINKRTGKVNLFINVTWVDGENASNTRPESINYKLYRDGVFYGDITVPKDNNWEYQYGENLEKYDEFGRVYEYELVRAGEVAEYEFSDGVRAYEVSQSSTENDKLTYSYEARLAGTTSISIYKKWYDTETGGSSRPDIYMTLYRKTYNQALDEEGEIFTDYTDQIWTAGTAENDYNWKITVENLPEYDESGHKYTYYMVETINNHSELSYITYYRKTLDGTDKTEQKAYDTEYIVNVLFDYMSVNGIKVWKNLSGFLVSELPNLEMYLYRYTNSQLNDTYTTPDALIAKGEITPMDVVVMDTSYGDGTKSTYSFPSAEFNNNTIISSTGTQKKVTYGREYIVDGKYVLPKYSNTGERYTYIVREAIQLDSDLYANFEHLYISHVLNFTMTNTFNTDVNVRDIAVTKTWDRGDVPDTEKGIYPDVTLNLYRYEMGNSAPTIEQITANNPYKTVTITSEEFAAKTDGTYEYVFKDELIVSPTGRYYAYVIIEEGINGYTTAYNDARGNSQTDGILITDKLSLKENAAGNNEVTAVGIKNTYTAYATEPKATLTGIKNWKDEGYAEAYRPEAGKVELALYRKTETGTEASTKTNETVTWTSSDKTDATWTYSASNLAIYGPDGNPYIYSIQETLKQKVENSTDKYHYSMSPSTGRVEMASGKGTNTIVMKELTNSLTKSYTVKINWFDGNNKYGLRASDVKVELQRKKTNDSSWGEVTTYEVNTLEAVLGTNGNSWQHVFENLPKYDFTSGEEYEYRCVETHIGTKKVLSNAAGAYTVDTEQGSDRTVINNELKSTSLTIIKTWDDSNNYYKTRPETIKFKLYNSENAVNPSWVEVKDVSNSPVIIEVSTNDSGLEKDGNTWTYVFNNLPVCNDDGASLYYKAVEITDDMQNYTNSGDIWSYNQDTGNQITTKNTLNVQITKVTVTKNWVKKDTTTEPTLTFVLKQDCNGTITNTFEKTMNVGTTEITWEKLPKCNAAGQAYTYTVEEKEVDGFISSSNVTGTDTEKTYAFTNIESMDFTVEKTWSDNTYGIKNTEKWTSDIKLMQSIDSGTNWTDVSGKIATIEMIDTTQTGSYVFENLPCYQSDGTKIEYKAAETKVNGVTSHKGYTVSYTNSEEKTAINNKLETVNLNITKNWDDNDNKYGIRPDSIEVSVKADYGDGNGAAALTDVPNIIWEKSDNTWSETVTGLPKYASDGITKIQYSIEENAVNGYSISYGETNSAANDFTITNTLKTQTISISKDWEDFNNKYGYRKTVKAGIYADGGQTPLASLEITEADNWTKEITGIPVYNKNGTKIVYSIKENSLYGYNNEPEITSNAATGKIEFTINNKLITTLIEGTKTWSDNNNSYGLRPTLGNGITLALYSAKNNSEDWTEVSTGLYTVEWSNGTADSDWKYSIKNLALQDSNGNVLKYKIEEKSCDDNYSLESNTNGNLVNSLNIIDLSGMKIWADNGNAYNTRPDSVKVITQSADSHTLENNVLALALYRSTDGSTWEQVTLDSGSIDVDCIKDGNVWNYTLPGLPKKSPDKSNYQYKIEEIGAAGYEQVESKDNNFINALLSELVLYKNDTSGNAVAAKNAEFTIYTDAECTDAVAKAVYSEDLTAYTITALSDKANSDGVKYVYDGKILRGSYYIKETKAPDGYVRDTTVRTLDATTANAQINGLTDNKWSNTKYEAKINLVNENDDLLGNYEFTILGKFVSSEGVSEEISINISSALAAEVLLNESSLTYNGKSYSMITEQLYTISQTKAPNGYIYNANPVIFRVNADGKIDKAATAGYAKVNNNAVPLITFIDYFEVYILKTDENRIPIDADKYGAAEFDITGDFVSGKEVIHIAAGDSRPLMGELKPNVLYTIKETKAPDGYIISSDYTFKVDGNGSVIEINGTTNTEIDKTFIPISNTAASINIINKDAADERIIAGTKYTISGSSFANSDKTEISFTGRESITEFKKFFITGIEYTLTETERYGGYKPLGDVVVFKLENDGKITIISTPKLSDDSPSAKLESDGKDTGLIIYNEKVSGSLTVYKHDTDITGVPIENVEYDLYTSNDEKLNTSPLVTDADGKFVYTGLAEGSYYLIETDAPEKFSVDAVKTEFSIGIGEAENITLHLINSRVNAEVIFSKVVEGTNEPVENAVFALYYKAAAADEYRFLVKAVTDKAGKAVISELPRGYYRLTELYAPDCITDGTETVEFIVDNTPDKQYNLGTFVNAKITVEDYTITKEWSGDEAFYKAVRPETVNVQLYRQLEGGRPETYGSVVTFGESDNWRYTWNDLASFAYIENGTDENGCPVFEKKEYQYYAVELETPEYYTEDYSTDGVIKNVFNVTGTGVLHIDLANIGGALKDVFEISVNIRYKGEYIKTYEDVIYLADSDSVNIILPANFEYEVKEIYTELYELERYTVSYRTPSGTIEVNKTSNAAVINTAKVWTSINNNTEITINQEAVKIPVGGSVGIISGMNEVTDNGAVDYISNSLIIKWRPDKNWANSNSFTITYRDYGETGITEGKQITITDCFDKNGVIKSADSECYDALRTRYNNFTIKQDSEGNIVLTLADDINGMPYTNNIAVDFLPTFAVENTSPGEGGEVAMYGGVNSSISDGIADNDGHNRYTTYKATASSYETHYVDLDSIIVSTEVDSQTIKINENGRFLALLGYDANGTLIYYEVTGKVNILETDVNGRVRKAEVECDEGTIPVTIGIKFVKAETAADGVIPDDLDDIEAGVIDDYIKWSFVLAFAATAIVSLLRKKRKKGY